MAHSRRNLLTHSSRRHRFLLVLTTAVVFCLHASQVQSFAPASVRQFVGSGANRHVETSSSPSLPNSRGFDQAVRRDAVVFHERPVCRLKSTSSLFSSMSENAAGGGAAYDEICDVLVIGSGPAACSIASLLSSPSSAKPLDVILADQNADGEWVPNYGVWQDEWQAICQRYQQEFGVELRGGKFGQAVDREWSVTDCYFGGSFDIPVAERLRLDRPYCRVDKVALKESLQPEGSYRVLRANHNSRAINVNLYAGNLMAHDETGTTVELRQSDGTVTTVRSKLVVDCTGHESLLVLKDASEKHRPPGFQIAYGVLVEVDSALSNPEIGPYDKEAMTLFDYRTDHFDADDAARISNVERAPTFMYAMPLYDNFIFFEETSLVARPAVSFQECKDRCFQRLKYHGINVKSVIEEEFCYIPMGGALPIRDQRVMALGGTAAMVHPSTGYSICRCLMGAADMASAVQKELLLQDENNEIIPDKVAAAAYHALWSPDNIRQRNFSVFGGEFLMKQNVVGLRGFFDGFFRLPLALWAGFLAGWPGLPNNEKHETWLARLWFGLSFVVRLPPPVALDMLTSIFTYSLAEGTPLLQSVTPFFGEPAGYEYKRNMDRIGDVAAKEEARKMIQESAVVPDIPVAFLPTGVQSLSSNPVEPTSAQDSKVGTFQ